MLITKEISITFLERGNKNLSIIQKKKTISQLKSSLALNVLSQSFFNYKKMSKFTAIQFPHKSTKKVFKNKAENKNNGFSDNI